MPLLLASLLLLAVGDPSAPARKELQPRPVTFSKSALPLRAALAELTAATGNAVADRRANATNPDVQLPAGPVSFWPALDALGKAAGVGFSAYGEAGGVALADAPYRPTPVAYAGLFRVAPRRLTLTRDLELNVHTLRAALDVAWEPRFEPFYLDLQKVRVTYAPDADGKRRQETFVSGGSVPVAGRSAVELDVRVPAPDRSSPKVAVLEGTLAAIGPTKMLDFAFKDLTPLAGKTPSTLAAEQEGVRVRVQGARFLRDVLAVDVAIENPKGGPGFESFQSWLDNNRLVLQSGKRKLTPDSSEVRLLTGDRARVIYHFEGQPLPPRGLEGWELHYRTPGRIVELREAFRLEGLPLP